MFQIAEPEVEAGRNEDLGQHNFYSRASANANIDVEGSK